MKKTLFLFALMSVFLLTGCGNDDILDGVADTDSEETSAEGMPFSATINATDVVVEDGGSDSPSGPAKALDDPGTSGKTINFRFKTGEKVALVYTVGSTKYLVQANVSSIENNGEKANITATLTGNPTTGTHVTAIFPYSAVDATTKDIKPDLLKNATQLGTIADISNKYDVRKGSSQFMIKNGKVSFVDACVMKLQYAICKFTFKDNINATLGVTDLFIYDNATGDVITTVKPAAETKSIYVAFKPSSSKMKFMVVTEKGPKKKVVNAGLNAGYYYRPTITLITPANITDDPVLDHDKYVIIGNKAGIYADIESCREGGESECAIICYVGNDPNANCKKGLALSLNTTTGYIYSAKAEDITGSNLRVQVLHRYLPAISPEIEGYPQPTWVEEDLKSTLLPLVPGFIRTGKPYLNYVNSNYPGWILPNLNQFLFMLKAHGSSIDDVNSTRSYIIETIKSNNSTQISIDAGNLADYWTYERWRGNRTQQTQKANVTLNPNDYFMTRDNTRDVYSAGLTLAPKNGSNLIYANEFVSCIDQDGDDTKGRKPLIAVFAF